MQSTLLLVTHDGALFQWPWHEPPAEIKRFVRLAELGLDREIVTQVCGMKKIRNWHEHDRGKASDMKN